MTLQKFATFGYGANFEPLSPALPGAFAFSAFLYPLDDFVSLTVGLLQVSTLPEESRGLTKFRVFNLRQA